MSSEVLKDVKSWPPLIYVHELQGEVKFIRETWQSWWLCLFSCLRHRLTSWHQNSFSCLRSQVHKYAYFMIPCGGHSLQLVIKSVRYLLTHCYKKNPVHLCWRLRAGFLVQRTGMNSGSLQRGIYEEKLPNRQVCFWRCTFLHTIFHPPNALCLYVTVIRVAVVRSSQRHVIPCAGLQLISGAMPNSSKETLTLRRLMSYIYIYIYIYIYGAPILDVSRSHTTTQHSR